MSEFYKLNDQAKSFYGSFSFGGSNGDIVPNDTAGTNKWIGLFVGGTGDVKVTKANGQTQTYKNVPDGYHIPAAVSRVYATGTTATNILGLTAWDEAITEYK